MSGSSRELTSLLLNCDRNVVFAFSHQGDGWIGTLAQENTEKCVKTIRLYRAEQGSLHPQSPNWLDFPQKFEGGFFEFSSILPDKKNPPPLLGKREWAQDKTQWDSLCKNVALKITEGKFDKIVPCRWRSSIIASSEKNSLIESISDLIVNAEIPDAYKFLVRLGDSIFFGATPELLFRRELGKISIPAIAGTRKIDGNNGHILEESEKDIREHELVVNGLITALSEMGLCPQIIQRRSLLRSGNLWHLHTLLEMPDPGHEALNSTTLISKLHPSAAICGYPKNAAMEFLRENEGWNRGLFASPILIRDGASEICMIAIRSALLRGDQFWQFAGAGFVFGSDAESEWNECEIKMNSISRFLFQETNK